MGDPPAKSTRSRKNSANIPCNKRKRSIDAATDNPTSKRMANGDEEPAVPEAGGPFTLAQFTHYMSTTNRKEVKEDIDAALSKVSVRIDATQAELAKHKLDMQSELANINRRLDICTGTPLPGPTYASAARSSPSTMPTAQSAEVQAYWRARRIAKMHCIEGNGEDELWKNLQLFLRNKMHIPTSELRKSDIVSVRKMRMRRDRQPRGEVIVVFLDVDT